MNEQKENDILDIMENDILDIMKNSSYVYEELFCYFSQMKGIPVYSYRLPCAHKFYRVRINQIDDFQKITELYAPPSHLVKNYSRANKPFQSVLYVSDNPGTVVAELKLFLIENTGIKNVIDIVQVEFVQEEELFLLIIPDFSNEKISERIVQEVSPEQLRFFKFINKFFCQAINPNENNKRVYQLTSAYCNAIRAESERRKKKIDGILYTSVEDKNGYNIVLRPDLINENKIRVNDIAKRSFVKIENDCFVEYNIKRPKVFDLSTNSIKWE